MNKLSQYILITLLLSLNSITAIASDGHNHQEGGHEEASVTLTKEQIKLAEIEIVTLKASNVSQVISAPGEVALNSYQTTAVTSRVTAQIVKRFVKLGDTVKKGKPLITLTSVEMLGAQGQLLLSSREWLRVKKLGQKVVSAQRYVQAKIAYEQAKNQVLAFGLTKKQLKAFLNEKSLAKAKGSFQLLASQDGTVIFDDFLLGELVSPGKKLMVISDESQVWVEAKLTPEQVLLVAKGNKANITVRNRQYSGKVIQIHHALDETTRTLGVRLSIDNNADSLHPGLFVQAKINSNQSEKVLSVPVNAVLRSPDGDWVIFKEHEKNEFEPQEVELLRTVGNIAVISGINEGARVVTKGAFFVQSELAKSGFKVHNH